MTRRTPTRCWRGSGPIWLTTVVITAMALTALVIALLGHGSDGLRL